MIIDTQKFQKILSKIGAIGRTLLPLVFLYLAWSYVSMENQIARAYFEIAVHQAEAIDVIARGFGGKGHTT